MAFMLAVALEAGEVADAPESAGKAVATEGLCALGLLCRLVAVAGGMLEIGEGPGGGAYRRRLCERSWRSGRVPMCETWPMCASVRRVGPPRVGRWPRRVGCWTGRAGEWMSRELPRQMLGRRRGSRSRHGEGSRGGPLGLSFGDGL
jgi:hypothetical protein